MSPTCRLLSLIACFSCLVSHCYGISPGATGPSNSLWLTGPLLTPSAKVVPPGHLNIEPYFYTIVSTAAYGDDWQAKSTPRFLQLFSQMQVKVGVIEKFDLFGIVQGYYNATQGQSATAFGDLPIVLEYQLYEGENSSLIKLFARETFPVGKYQRSNPKKLRTDLGGMGSFVSATGFTISRVYHFGGEHYLRPRFNLALSFSAPVHVRGINAYGGDPSTKGWVYPGNSAAFLFGAEYTLTKNWALAIDINGRMSGRTRFNGYSATAVAAPSSAQFSLAPAIEYNWSPTKGIIIGSWFTVAGKNSKRFYSAAAAYNWYY